MASEKLKKLNKSMTQEVVQEVKAKNDATIEEKVQEKGAVEAEVKMLKR